MPKNGTSTRNISTSPGSHRGRLEDFPCRLSIHPDRNVKLCCHIHDVQNLAASQVITIHLYHFVESTSRRYPRAPPC